MVNRVILVGNLGRDPEVRDLENGVKVARFSVATNESYKDKNGEFQTQTEWHDVVAWRLLAERAQNYLKKGKLVYIEGKLTHRKYQDKDGNDRYVTEVVADTIRNLSREERTDHFPGADQDPFANREDPRKNTEQIPVNAEAPSDDLPF